MRLALTGSRRTLFRPSVLRHFAAAVLHTLVLAVSFSPTSEHYNTRYGARSVCGCLRRRLLLRLSAVLSGERLYPTRGYAPIPPAAATTLDAFYTVATLPLRGFFSQPQFSTATGRPRAWITGFWAVGSRVPTNLHLPRWRSSIRFSPVVPAHVFTYRMPLPCLAHRYPPPTFPTFRPPTWGAWPVHAALPCTHALLPSPFRAYCPMPH